MNNPHPFFSVIIPTYNRADKLKRCLESLTHQTFGNFEVLVCDDGSTDNSKEIVEKFKQILAIKYFYSENFGGPARPRNIGISNALGKWICFLDSDDSWYPNKLEETMKYTDNFDFIYHDLVVVNNFGTKKGIIKSRDLINDLRKDILINGNPIPNSSVSVSKNIIDKVGKINENKNFVAVEDADYWIKIAKITKRFKYMPISLGIYQIGNNISFNIKQIAAETTLFNHHKCILNLSESAQANLLFSFRKARIYHFCKQYKNAQKEYIISIDHPKISLKLKSFIGYLLCSFKIKL